MRTLPVRLMLLVLLAAPAVAHAQRLALTRFYEELSQSQVTSLLVDSPGFLWIGTFEGLTRFDGHEFRSYGPLEGFDHPIVNDVIEGPDGSLWIATNGAGVARLLESVPAPNGTAGSSPGPRRFVSFPIGEGAFVNAVNAMAFDDAGHLWCATDDGTYRSDRPVGLARPAFQEVPGSRGVAFAGIARASGRMFLLGSIRGRPQSGRLLVVPPNGEASLVDEWTAGRSELIVAIGDRVLVGRDRQLVRYAFSKDGIPRARRAAPPPEPAAP